MVVQALLDESFKSCLNLSVQVRFDVNMTIVHLFLDNEYPFDMA